MVTAHDDDSQPVDTPGPAPTSIALITCGDPCRVYFDPVILDREHISLTPSYGMTSGKELGTI